MDSNGVVHALFAADGYRPPTVTGDPDLRPLIYRRSSDGGRTWSPIKEIDPGSAGFSFMRKQMIAVDATSGALYATWYGNPNPRARRPPAGQPSTNDFDDRDIYVRVSRKPKFAPGSVIRVKVDPQAPDRVVVIGPADETG